MPYSSKKVQLKSRDIIYILKIRRLKSKEKKVNQLEDTRPKYWHGGDFPGFSVFLIQPKLLVEEFGNSEKQTGMDKEKSDESLLSLFKLPGKEQPNKTGNI